jgi:hypothetical protein
MLQRLNATYRKMPDDGALAWASVQECRPTATVRLGLADRVDPDGDEVGGFFLGPALRHVPVFEPENALYRVEEKVLVEGGCLRREFGEVVVVGGLCGRSYLARTRALGDAAGPIAGVSESQSA